MSLAWDRNPETTVIGYRVYVGITSGTYAASYDVGNQTTFNFTAGTVGVRYYFRVTAYVSGPLEGPGSNEVTTVVLDDGSGGTGGTPPPPPGDETGGDDPDGGTDPGTDPGTEPPPDGTSEGSVALKPATVRGSSVTLSWKPSGGLKVTEYMVEAGSGPGQSNLYNGSVGDATSVSGTVGEGTYYARVRAKTKSSGSTITSNEISFSINTDGSTCTSPPPTPARPSGDLTNGVAVVSWRATAGATSYVVQVGSASGLSDLFNADVGAFTSLSSQVSAGFKAYVRVIAVNACGRSAASSEITIR